MIGEFLKDLFALYGGLSLQFSQFYFWAFFLFVFAGFALLQNRVLMRNAFLFFVSIFFYMKTGGLFVLLLLFTILFNYLWAHLIDKTNREKKRKATLLIGLCVNLFFLCYYKYPYFFTGIINDIFHTDIQVFDLFSSLGNIMAGRERFNISRILLPIGISFFTFQNLSYIIDVFKRKAKPVENIIDYGFYVSFFPKLLLGPIVRINDFLPQMQKKYFLSRRQFGIAVFWILNGLTKKIVLGDFIAVNFVDRVFVTPTMFTGFENLLALFGYSLQVYADFSGYTDIAIGLAMLMGFYLPRNFNSPYKATNAGDFWKRWHITLSSWLRDYLYIPMGGNRNASFATYFLIVTIALIALILSGSVWIGIIFLVVTVFLVFIAYKYPEQRKKITTNINLMNTMLIGGIWHGPSWNFMIWGGLNGLGIVIYKFWRNWNVNVQTIILLSLSCIALLIAYFFPAPVWNIAFVWLLLLSLGSFVKMTYSFVGGKKAHKWIINAWAIFQTFIFISFTRLFFRTGSNLDPSDANQAAWDTAKEMITQIGGKWNFSSIGTIIVEYSFVFALILIGLIIHWLPENWKRRYRIMFTRMPLPVMALFVVLAVFVIYQFITADLQSFIYSQF